MQFLVNSLGIASVYVLASLGFGVIYGNTRIFHFAHGTIFTVSAYTFTMIFPYLGWAAFLAAIFSGGAAGAILYLFIYDPLLQRGDRDSTLIAALGVDLIGVNLLAIFFGSGPRTIAPVTGILVTISDVIITNSQAIRLGVLALGLLGFWFFMHRSHSGIILRAFTTVGSTTSIDTDAPTWFGVSPRLQRTVSFIIGSNLAALAASAHTLEGGVDPFVGFNITMISVTATIIGTVGVHIGTIVGAVFLALAQGAVGWFISPKWETTVTFLILAGFLFFRPEGLFPVSERAEKKQN